MKKFKFSQITQQLRRDISSYEKAMDGVLANILVSSLCLKAVEGVSEIKGEVNLHGEVEGFSYANSLSFTSKRKFQRDNMPSEVCRALGLRTTPYFLEFFDLNWKPYTYVVRADTRKKRSPLRSQKYFLVIEEDHAPSSAEIGGALSAFDDENELGLTFLKRNVKVVWGEKATVVRRWLRSEVSLLLSTEPDIALKDCVTCETCVEAACCRVYTDVVLSEADVRRLSRAFTTDDGKPAKPADLYREGVITRIENPSDDLAVAYLAHHSTPRPGYSDCALLVTSHGGKKICSVWDHRPDVCRVYNAPNGSDCDIHDKNYDDSGPIAGVKLKDLQYPLPKQPPIGSLKLKEKKTGSKALPVLK